MALTTTVSAATPLPLKQRAVALAALVALLGGALMLGQQGWRYGALLLIGTLLGMSLYHAAFGFTSAYRHALVHRDVTGVVAQLVMLGLAMLLFAPVLARGEAFGHGVVGALAPAGLQVAIGSFLFGLGMQLGGGCGSGTLYTVGGGSARMLVTLVAFCAGAFAGSLDMARYAGLPSLGTVSLAADSALPLRSCCSSPSWQHCGSAFVAGAAGPHSGRSGEKGSRGEASWRARGRCCSAPSCSRC